MERNRGKGYKINKRDIGWMLLIMLIYGALSFIQLGSLENPQTFWEKSAFEGEYTVVKLNEVQDVAKLRSFCGPKFGEYKLYTSEDGKRFIYAGKLEQDKVFAWSDKILDKRFKYLGLEATEKLGSIGELAFYNAKGERLESTYETEDAKALVDERDRVPEKITFLTNTYFDEVYHARTAYEYIHDLEIYEWTHPPLGKLIIGLPVRLWGMNTFSYRLMGNLAGILMLPVIYILAKKLFGHTRYGLAAALLLAADGMHFVQTRIATVDSFLVLFVLLSYLFMFCYIRCEDKEPLSMKLSYLFFSGLFLGAAIATKWNGAYSAVGLAILFFADLFKRSSNKYHRHMWDRQVGVILFSCVLFFVILPVGIYLGSYLPFFHSEGGKSFKDFVDLQIQMYRYHSELEATHPFTSPWYLWPLNIKPIWYFKGEARPGYVITIALLGNPLIWWSGLIGMLYTVRNVFVKRRKEDFFILVAILSLYLPYAFVPRIMFLYHYFPVVPFMILALVSLLKEGVRRMDSTAIIKGYIAVAMIVFVFFYPIYSGTEIPIWYAAMTRWLPAWQYF
ncbi:phospholipid carrier-dependent glycosyltransferase [Sporanaerobium hydrogeniformans]|uniref:Phospholipid carrier-dependent glycosyltransferase n=1 Tax=Sporanaerobium hydrogeniformans TaxID=3072179 RepID=A0AC61DD13_9FIRM|nr:phospholipid carrier-dependent glycosyltransferase [Sporanaerobium hydrogeniformans]PHV70857.1 phospholipid carrier-dependent glycosyltransferase [Sporanaerobium hydrogeniformans]